MLRLLTIGLLFAINAFSSPTLTMVVCDTPKVDGAPSAHAVRCSWITDVNSTHVIKVYLTSGGSVWQTVTRFQGEFLRDARTHSVVVGGLSASTTYYLRACSENTGTNCSSEQTATTGAEIASWEPTPPTAVDNSWTSGTVGSPVDVGSDCNSTVDGLQATYDGAANGTKIRIPTTTLNCTTMLKPSSAKTGIEITTDSTNRPPAGVTDSTAFGHSKWYRAWFNYGSLDGATMASLTGKVDMNTYSPGSIVFQYLSPAWNLKKASLSGSPVVITNASNTNPILITTATPHGFSNGDAVMIDGVLGNIAANGGFIAANVTSTTLTIKTRNVGFVSGSNQQGSGAYTSGGQLQGLNWTVITPATQQHGLLFGSCSTANSWGWNQDAPYFTFGMYRCGTDHLWYQVHNHDDAGVDGDTNDYTSNINMPVNGTRLRVTGIDFADLPVDPEPEYAYGPRQTGTIVTGVYGGTIGSVYQGGRGTDRIDLNQNLALSDLTKWRMILMMYGVTTNLSVRNNSLSCGGYQLVYISEVEMPCNIMGFENSAGPILEHNNNIYVGSFGYFAAEPSTFVRHQNITITKNYFRGVLNFAYGTPYYDQVTRTTQPITIKTRQLVEFKTGNNIEISGNVFDGLAFSISPTAPGLSMGTQTGYTNTITIDSSGVVGVNPQRPLPLSLSANDKMMLFDNSSGNPAILRIASIASNIITLKNLDGTPYSFATQSYGSLCALDMEYSVSNANVHDNTFVNVPQGWNIFGTSYSYGSICQSGPASKMKFTNNIGSLVPIGQTGGWFGTPTALAVVTGPWVSGLVDYTQIHNNTFYPQDASISNFNSSFVSDTSFVNYKNYGLSVKNNIIPGENYGVYNDGSTQGTTVLDGRWPLGWTYTNNGVPRTGGTISNEPLGQTYPLIADLLWVQPSVLDFRYLAASLYRTNTTDGYPNGYDYATLNTYQGRVANQRATAGSGSLTIYWSYGGGAPCTVDASNDGFVTYTRGTSSTSTYVQSKTLSLAAGPWSYRVLCPGTVTPVVISTATVN